MWELPSTDTSEEVTRELESYWQKEFDSYKKRVKEVNENLNVKHKTGTTENIEMVSLISKVIKFKK
jgi:hypothetical protein